MKYILYTTSIIIVVAVFGSLYYFLTNNNKEEVVVENTAPPMQVEPVEKVEQEVVATSTTERGPMTVLGNSVNGFPINAYHFGSGEDELLFVGGIHGGYEWNTTLVAYELIDYLEENPEAIPENVTVTVIPLLNPDGLDLIFGTTERFTLADTPETVDETIPGRFNGNTVDLNRNFACDWQAEGTWKSTTVDAGTEAFSEPESQALKLYVEVHKPTAVVAWYSAAGGVYSSNCHNGVLEETTELTNLYAAASGYPAHKTFDFYTITGDMVNWFASKNIPAISVLLTTHEAVEWDKNKRGIDALLEYYAK